MAVEARDERTGGLYLLKRGGDIWHAATPNTYGNYSKVMMGADMLKRLILFLNLTVNQRNNVIKHKQ